MEKETEQLPEQTNTEQEATLTDTFSSADRMILNVVISNNRLLAEIAKKLGVELEVAKDG